MPEATGFKTGNIVERDKVHAAMIKAIPAAPERSLTEAREISFARRFIEPLMLARDVKHGQACFLRNHVGVVKLDIFGGRCKLPVGYRPSCGLFASSRWKRPTRWSSARECPVLMLPQRKR